MVSKDQAIGGLIFAVCVIVGVFYFVTLVYPNWLGFFGQNTQNASVRFWDMFWVIAVPVLIGFLAIMGIGAWIGWTMATTPPPKPIEEITSEMEKEEKPTAEEKPAEETPKEEAKKPERKKKAEAEE